MGNGDLQWFDYSVDVLGPAGALWHSEQLRYRYVDDRGFLRYDIIDVSEKRNRTIPNVTTDFQSLMTRVKWGGQGLRLLSELSLWGREAGMAFLYGPHMPCDIENTRAPYSTHNFVRLFGEVMENDDPGNFLYGYGASAAGYPPDVVLAAGGLVQMATDIYHGEPFKNTPTRDSWKDIMWIMRGIKLYNSGGEF